MDTGIPGDLEMSVKLSGKVTDGNATCCKDGRTCGSVLRGYTCVQAKTCMKVDMPFGPALIPFLDAR